MVERKTRVRGAQVLAKSIAASDLDGSGETIGNVATVQSDGTIAYDTPVAGTPTSIQDSDGDTKVETEKNADEDIIRFTAFATQEAQVDVNGLTLKTGASVNEFSIDGTLAGDSDDAVPTEKAVKAFVEAFKPTDLNITGQAEEDFLLFSSGVWKSLGGTELKKVGNFTRDNTLADGSQEITGVGFRPSSVIFIAAVVSTGAVSIAITDGTTTQNILNKHEESANQWSFQQRVVSMFTGISIGNGAIFSSFTSDGFIINWNKQGSPTGTSTVSFIAFR